MTRGKGEGAVYKRAADGMWCTSIELPRGLDGKRRRKVVCRRSKAEVLTELARIHAVEPPAEMTLQQAVDTILDAIRGRNGKQWRGTSRRIP